MLLFSELALDDVKLFGQVFEGGLPLTRIMIGLLLDFTFNLFEFALVLVTLLSESLDFLVRCLKLNMKLLDRLLKLAYLFISGSQL